MAHQYKEVERPQAYLVPVDVICDRCGKKAGISGADPKAVAWGEATAWLQGESFKRSADLCRSCAEEFVEWVNDGAGEGVRDGSEPPEIVKPIEDTAPKGVFRE